MLVFSFLSLIGFKNRRKKKASSKTGFALVCHYQKYNSFCIDFCVLAMTVHEYLIVNDFAFKDLLHTRNCDRVLHLYSFIEFSQ